MAALLWCLVLFLLSTPLHEYAEASGRQHDEALPEEQAGRAPSHSDRFSGAGSAFRAYAPFRARSSSDAYSPLRAGREAYPSLRAGSSSEAYPTFGPSSSAVANSSGGAGSSMGANSSGEAGLPSLVFKAGRTASRRPPRRRREPKPFACTDCPRSYARQRSLAEHRKSHETDETTCPFCQLVCSRKCNLKLHIEMVHLGASLLPKRVIGRPPVYPENESGAFICGKCGQSYASRGSLNDHERCHETLDTYCFRCQKTLGSKTSYRVHMKRRHPEDALAEKAVEKRKYEEDNPVKCEQCPKRFKNSNGLRLHQKYHDGETECNECGTVFPRPSCLSKHKRKAHSNRPEG